MLLIWILVVTGFLSFVFSGAETGLYRLSRVRLRIGIEKRSFSYRLLGKAIADGPGLLLATLIGNNLANYVATSAVMALLLRVVTDTSTAEALTTAVTAPVFFVFAEMIPKSLFLYRADTLMPYAGPVLFVSHRVLQWSGVIGVLKAVSDLFAKVVGSERSSTNLVSGTPKQHIRAILAESREEGLLSHVQADIVGRLATIPHTPLRAVMTPLGRVETVDVTCGRDGLLKVLREHPFTRLPVYEGRPDHIIGYLNIYDALADGGNLADLQPLVKPIHRLAAETSVTHAIELMRRRGHPIVLVEHRGLAGQARPIGIVTMKDLVEELVGELAAW